ncbi:unnamed protein product, partial [Ixodes pacificus]
FWCSFWHWPWCLLGKATAVTAVITEDMVMEATAMGAATEKGATATEDTDTEDLSDTEDITATTEATVMEEDKAKGATATDMDTEVIAAMADMADTVTVDSMGGREKAPELPKQISFPVPRSASSSKDEIYLRMFVSFSS